MQRIINYISIMLVSGLLGVNIYLTLSEQREPSPESSLGFIEAVTREVSAAPPQNAVPANLAGLESWMIETERNNIQVFEGSQFSVVHVTNNRFYRRLFSLDVNTVPQGTGTGIVWDKSGLILTNYHVIAQASQVLIKLHDKSVYEASLIGLDPNKDIALLKIDAPAHKLQPIRFGDSRNLKVGQKVLAIGNPFGFDQTLTVGVISALEREINSPSGVPIRGVIQTDAAINPGNSGGPLLNSRGELIGINTQIYSVSGGSSGIGFAIPIDKAQNVISMLVKYGKVVRPYLGVTMLDGSIASYYDIKGAVIKEVETGSPAGKAGLEGIRVDRNRNFYLGDIVIAVADVPINADDDLFLELEKYAPGDQVDLTVLNNSKKRVVRITLGDLR